MFARILDFEVKAEKKEEFVKVLKNEVLPILNQRSEPFTPPISH